MQPACKVKSYTFYTEDALKYGVDQAIMLSNIKFWVATNEANNRNEYKGYFWTYNSAQAFTNLFPFWSRKKISRILNDLEGKGAIVSRKNNPHSSDHTKAYTLPKIRLDKNDQSLDKNDQSYYTENKQQKENSNSKSSNSHLKYKIFNSCKKNKTAQDKYSCFYKYILIHDSHWKQKHIPLKNETIKEYELFTRKMISSFGIDCVDHYMSEFQIIDTKSDRHFPVFAHWLFSQLADDDYRGFTAQGDKMIVEEMLQWIEDSE